MSLQDPEVEERVYSALKSTLSKDLFALLEGEHLGSGMSRVVVRNRLDRHSVIKVENSGDRFQNVMEWRTWVDAEGTPAEKWLCPCIALSPNGIVLVQKYAEPIRCKSQLPVKVPPFITDFKMENWGIYEGRPVCVDYGINMSIHLSMTSRRLVKAPWWIAGDAE